MPVAAVVDERRLQRRLDPGDLGEVDVAGELPLVQRLEVELIDPGSVHHHHAGLFRVGGVDQHFLCHDVFRERERRARPASRPRLASFMGVPKRADRPGTTGPSRSRSVGIGSGPARFTAVLLRRGKPTCVRPGPSSVRAAGPGRFHHGARTRLSQVCRDHPRRLQRSCNAASVRRIRVGSGCHATDPNCDLIQQMPKRQMVFPGPGHSAARCRGGAGAVPARGLTPPRAGFLTFPEGVR